MTALTPITIVAIKAIVTQLNKIANPLVMLSPSYLAGCLTIAVSVSLVSLLFHLTVYQICQACYPC